jgi:hypothetical protein
LIADFSKDNKDIAAYKSQRNLVLFETSKKVSEAKIEAKKF